MGLASDVERNLLTAWGLANFAEGMHGRDGHDPELLNWRIARVEDHGRGGIMVHLNVPHGSTSRGDMKLLSRRILTLNTGRLAELQSATVVDLDEQYAETTHRDELPKAPGLGTA